MRTGQLECLSVPVSPTDVVRKTELDQTNSDLAQTTSDLAQTNTNLAQTDTNLVNHELNFNNPHQTTLELARLQNSQVNGDIDLNSNILINLKNPTNPHDATNKFYVDNIAVGITVKDSVRVGTTAALSTTYLAIAQTLTATSNGAISIDDIPLSISNRVLVKNQTISTENGIYTVTTVGSGITPYVLTRALDYNNSALIDNGDFVLINAGTININSGWVMTTPNPITLDVSPLVWAQFSVSETIMPGTALTKTGETLDVNTDGTSITVSGNNLTIASAGVSNSMLDKSNIPLSGFGAAAANVNLGSQKIINLATPTNTNDAVNKNYVDTLPLSALAAATGNVDLGSQKIVNLATPTSANDAVNKNYVDTLPLSALAAATGNVDLGSQKIVNLATPTSANDATTKQYVDSIAVGITVKDSVKVGTTTALSTIYLAQTLTATGNGAISIDDIALSVNNRVLVKNQIVSTENGIYTVTTVGSGITPYVLTRATDFNTSGKISNGDFVLISAGTININSGWVMTTPNPITLDVSPLAWAQFSASETIMPGTALTKIGETLNVNTDTSTITVSSNNLTLNKSNIPLSGFGAAVANVDLGSQKIINLATPTSANDAVNKNYVDTLPLSIFAAATGNVDLGSQKIINLATPTSANDAVNKNYSDSVAGIVSTISGNTAAVNKQILLCNTVGGSFTVTLPTPAANAVITIKKISSDGFTITLAPHASETIDGKSSIILSGQYNSMTVVCDGTNWYII